MMFYLKFDLRRTTLRIKKGITFYSAVVVNITLSVMVHICLNYFTYFSGNVVNLGKWACYF